MQHISAREAKKRFGRLSVCGGIGEPLVRKGIMTLVESLGRHLRSGGLDELTLTTNGSQLAKYAGELAAHGVRRINVSVDTLDAAKFKTFTRWGDLAKVKDGIRAAQAAGLAIKINAVALKGVNDAEIPEMIRWTHGEGMDLTLIETMPLGDIEGDRTDQYLPLSVVRAGLMDRFTLEDIPYKTGGPGRFVKVKETGGRLGFITPLTHNFCESCNRVRLTCTGTLYMCLGQEDAANLRAPMQASEGDGLLNAALPAGCCLRPGLPGTPRGRSRKSCNRRGTRKGNVGLRGPARSGAGVPKSIFPLNPANSGSTICCADAIRQTHCLFNVFRQSIL